MGFYPPATLVRDAQRRGVETRPPRREPQRGRLRASRTERRPRRAEVRRRAWERRRGGSWSRTGRTARSATWRSAPRLRDDSLRRSSSRAPATVRAVLCWQGSPRPRDLLWQLGARAARRRAVPRSGRGAQQLALPLDPTAATPSCPSRRCGSGCSPTTGRRASRSASTRSSCCARTCRRGRSRREDLLERPHGADVRIAGLVVARQRPATANGVVFMLLEDEHAQVNLIVPPHGLRALPGRRPRRAAPARPRPLRARRPQPQRARPRARLARPARPRADRRRRRARLAAARAHFGRR